MVPTVQVRGRAGSLFGLLLVNRPQSPAQSHRPVTATRFKSRLQRLGEFRGHSRSLKRVRHQVAGLGNQFLGEDVGRLLPGVPLLAGLSVVSDDIPNVKFQSPLVVARFGVAEQFQRADSVTGTFFTPPRLPPRRMVCIGGSFNN